MLKAATTLVWLIMVSEEVHAARIDAPSTSPVYSLVRCTTAHKGAGFAWFITGPSGFADSVAAEDGRLCVFTGPPGTYRVMLVVSHPSGKLEQGQTTVRITGEPGPQPTPPGPEPGPTPPEPSSRYGLDKLALESLARVKLPAELRVKLARAVGKNFAAVASAIRAGVVPDLDDADQRVSGLNRATLGTHRRIWHEWLLEMSARFNALEKSKEISTVSDKGDAFIEVAAGLERAK